MQHPADANDAAIERELGSLRLKSEERPVMKAYLQFRGGMPVDQRCQPRGGAVEVASPGPGV